MSVKPTTLAAMTAAVLAEHDQLIKAHRKDGFLDPETTAAYQLSKAALLERVDEHLTPPTPGELELLEEERRLLLLQMRELLASQGVEHLVEVGTQFMEQLQRVRLWDDSPLAPNLRARLERLHARLELLESQIAALAAAATEPSPGTSTNPL